MKSFISRRRLKPRLCFMHVPKAAGTTIINQIEFNLRPKRSEYWLDGTQFGAFDRFDTMHPDIKSGIIFDVGQISEDTDVLMGHMGKNTFERRFPDANMATIVREPTMRLVSQWLYNRTYDDSRAALYGDWGRMVTLSRLPLQEFSSHPDIFCLIDNTLTRMLLWPHPLIPENGPIDPIHDDLLYKDAFDALSRFNYIDSAENENLIEDFSAWLDLTYGRAIVSRIKNLIGNDDYMIIKNGFNFRNYQKSFNIETEIANAETILQVRTRIDRKLWRSIVSDRLGESVDIFERRAWHSALSRYRDSKAA